MPSILMVIFSTVEEHVVLFVMLRAMLPAFMILTGLPSMGEMFEIQKKIVDACPACM
jgi:hypothetical protein